MGISVFSVALILGKKGLRQRQNKLIFILFCADFFASFFDIMTAFGNNPLSDWKPISRSFFNYGYLCLQNMMPYLLTCYVVCIVGLTYRLGKKQIKQHFALLAIPWLLCDVLLLTNPFTHTVFYFDERGNYCHGVGMAGLYVLAYLYLVYIFYLVFRYGHRTVRTTRYMLVAYGVVTTLSVVIEMIFEGTLIQLFVESVCLLGLAVTVDNAAEVVDFVTTCYNRQRFVRDCDLGIENKATFDIILIKIPGLRSYNISIGIDEMNRVMRSLGLWLRSVAKDSDVYYCEDGCFVILCDRNTVSNDIEPALRKRFLGDFAAGRTAVRFRPQISHARVGIDFKNHEQLLTWISNFDIEASGPVMGTVAVTASDYKKELVVQRAIENALRFDEFEVVYQPIWDARNNRISDAEALVRLYDDADDSISPDMFISFAERRGYISEIGEYVFENVCRFIATHELEKIGVERIHINLSPYQCMNELLPSHFEKIREKYNVPAEMIIFEIADNGSMENFRTIEKTINTLYGLGYRFAADNVGLTNLEINYIFRLPFSMLKFDKDFLWRAERNIKANTFFSGVLRIAREMNMKTIVLGVEVAAQKTLLQNYECDYLQGYYYQKPIPAEQFYRYCIGFNSKE